MYISMYYNITVVIYMEKISETCSVGWVEFCTDLLADMLEQDLINVIEHNFLFNLFFAFLGSKTFESVKI